MAERTLVIGPYYGLRYFRLIPGVHLASIVPVNDSYIQPGWNVAGHNLGYSTTPGQPWTFLAEAGSSSNFRLAHGPAPREDCACGFYASTTINDLNASINDMSFRYTRSKLQWALARVELAGTIIEHERGVRAQRLRVESLGMPSGWDWTKRDLRSLASRLATHYGVPVADNWATLLKAVT